MSIMSISELHLQLLPLCISYFLRLLHMPRFKTSTFVLTATVDIFATFIRYHTGKLYVLYSFCFNLSTIIFLHCPNRDN